MYFHEKQWSIWYASDLYKNALYFEILILVSSSMFRQAREDETLGE